MPQDTAQMPQTDEGQDPNAELNAGLQNQAPPPPDGIPMISPDYKDSRVIPAEAQDAARSAGWEEATKMIHPSGDIRWAPKSKVDQFKQAGYADTSDIKAPFSYGKMAKGAASEAGGMAKGIMESSGPGQLMSAFTDIPSEYRAYEQARQGGKGILDSAKAASETIQRKNDLLGQLKDRIDEFTTHPDTATGRMIVDMVPLILGGKLGAAEEGAGEAAGAEGASEPGIVQQVMKGKNVAQPAARSALQEAAGTKTSSLRESLSEAIEGAEANAKELYKQIDDASGADIKGLGEKLRTVNRAIRKSVSDSEDAALESRRDAITERIQAAKQSAIQRGVDPKVLDQADAEFKRMSALTDVEKRVVKNPDIVQGNEAHGTPPTVDIDKAVKALQKLQDNEKYGGPRLEQAFGEDGAKKLLDKFYSAQRQGVHAMKMQQVAKWIAGVAGAGAAAKGISTLAGAKDTQ
jgi:hypothetical protein